MCPCRGRLCIIRVVLFAALSLTTRLGYYYYCCYYYYRVQTVSSSSPKTFEYNNVIVNNAARDKPILRFVYVIYVRAGLQWYAYIIAIPACIYWVVRVRYNVDWPGRIIMTRTTHPRNVSVALLSTANNDRTTKTYVINRRVLRRVFVSFFIRLARSCGSETTRRIWFFQWHCSTWVPTRKKYVYSSTPPSRFTDEYKS